MVACTQISNLGKGSPEVVTTRSSLHLSFSVGKAGADLSETDDGDMQMEKSILSITDCSVLYSSYVDVTESPFFRRVSERFRSRRNRALSDWIAEMNGPRILDVGGHPMFWRTVANAHLASAIDIVNSEAGEHASVDEMSRAELLPNMSVAYGNATKLAFADLEYDLVVCNAVLEHVSGWANAEAAAGELVRVAAHGWVQVPAYEFPLEVHYMRPFVHWFAEPTRAWMLRHSGKKFKRFDEKGFRELFLFVQLLTRREMRYLFPGATIESERFRGCPEFRGTSVAVR